MIEHSLCFSVSASYFSGIEPEDDILQIQGGGCHGLATYKGWHYIGETKAPSWEVHNIPTSQLSEVDMRYA